MGVSTNPEHLSDRGFDRLPPVPGTDGGEARVFESSAAIGPHIWLKVTCPAGLNQPTGPTVDATVHLTTENAWRFAEQVMFLVKNHYQDDAEVLHLIAERDEAIEWADRLAAIIAPPRVRGEHSNTNEPWANALEYAQTILRGRGIESFVDEAADYEYLRDHIIDKLNPRDDDIAEPALRTSGRDNS